MRSITFRLPLALSLLLLGACGSDKKADSPPSEDPAADEASGTEDDSADEAAPASGDKATRGAAAHAALGTDDWVEFVDPAGRYKARYPAKPTQQDQQAPSELGTLEFKMALYVDPGEAYGLFSMAHELPVPEGAPFDVQAGLDGSRDGMIGDMNATLDQEERIERSGLPGRELRYHLPGPGGKTIHGVAHIYANDTPPTLYQANVIFNGTPDESISNRFFDGYQILGRDE